MITSFPIDIIKIIRDRLNRKDIFNFYLTCKTFNLTNDTMSQERFIRLCMKSDVIEKLLKFDMSNSCKLEKMKRIYGKFKNFEWKFPSADYCAGVCKRSYGGYISLVMKIYGNRPEENHFVYVYKSSNDTGFLIAFFAIPEVLASDGQITVSQRRQKSYVDFSFYVYGKDDMNFKLDLDQYDGQTAYYFNDIHQFRTLREYHGHVKKCLEICALKNADLAKIMEEVPMEKIFGGI